MCKTSRLLLGGEFLQGGHTARLVVIVVFQLQHGGQAEEEKT